MPGFPQPFLFGTWTVMFTYTDAQLVDTFSASTFQFSTGGNAYLTFVPAASGPPPIAYTPGVWPLWRVPVPPGPHAPGVWHTVEWSHTPTDENYTVDGVPIAGIDPGSQAAYDTQNTNFPATTVSFEVLGAKSGAFDNTAVASFGPIRLGTTPGGNDILDYDPAVDGLAPWTGTNGTVAIVGGLLVCGPANADPLHIDEPQGVWLDFPTPPPTFTFQCSFSVGVTNVMRMTPNLPPPDDKVLVQAALPETLLPEGYRIEVGVYNPDGTPFAASTERDTTLAFKGLDDEDDDTE